MNIETGRFGQLTIGDEEVITFHQGILGFTDAKRFCLVDPGDDTLILWLQSLDQPSVAFPVLEPKIFRPDFTARLSAAELRELRLDNMNQSAVFCILTIGDDVTQMTANMKAPVVLNLREQVGRQVVLQENDYGIKHPVFKELRTHIITLQSQKRNADRAHSEVHSGPQNVPVAIKNIPPSLTVKSLH